MSAVDRRSEYRSTASVTCTLMSQTSIAVHAGNIPWLARARVLLRPRVAPTATMVPNRPRESANRPVTGAIQLTRLTRRPAQERM